MFARTCLASFIEDLQTDEVHFGSDALEFVVRERAAAANQPRDVRAVAIIVVRDRRNPAVREIEETGDAAAEVGARRDAGIDNGDADAGGARRHVGIEVGVVGQAERVAQRARQSGLRAGRGAAHERICGNRADASVVGVIADVGAGNFAAEAIDDGVFGFDRRVVALQCLPYCIAAPWIGDDDDSLAKDAARDSGLHRTIDFLRSRTARRLETCSEKAGGKDNKERRNSGEHTRHGRATGTPTDDSADYIF